MTLKQLIKKLDKNKYTKWFETMEEAYFAPMECNKIQIFNIIRNFIQCRINEEDKKKEKNKNQTN